MKYKLKKIEQIIKKYYKKEKYFTASFVYLKSTRTLYHINIVTHKKNGIPYDYNIKIINYTKSKSEKFNYLDLILQMYDCNITDTTNAYNSFQLITKDTHEQINVMLDFIDNEFLGSSPGVMIYE